MERKSWGEHTAFVSCNNKQNVSPRGTRLRSNTTGLCQASGLEGSGEVRSLEAPSGLLLSHWQDDPSITSSAHSWANRTASTTGAEDVSVLRSASRWQQHLRGCPGLSNEIQTKCIGLWPSPAGPPAVSNDIQLCCGCGCVKGLSVSVRTEEPVLLPRRAASSHTAPRYTPVGNFRQTSSTAGRGTMVEPDPKASAAGPRLGAPVTLGISTLDPGLRPPAMPAGRRVTVRVRMLDDSEELFDVSQRAPGKVLFDLVCTHMNLIEGDYFGLEFQDHHKMTVWLDLIKPLMKQLRRPKHTVLCFVVKFYPPDPAQLLEELTRYLFALQLKQDLSAGRLTCNDSSSALMVSHVVQSEIGDFEGSQSRSHLLNNNYIPDQMSLMDRIMEFHSKNTGQTPAESDYQLLEVARRLEMYGVRQHPAKDREGTQLSLAASHTGVLVFQGHTRINAFNWSKVRKLSFKRKRFLIKLRADLNSSYQDTLEFLMGSRDCCKVFWKICVEYHAFFRLFEEPKRKPKPVLFTRGSSFRFSGRTQKQVIDYVKESEFKKIPFERKHSRVQHVCRLSPVPSPRRQEVPSEQRGAPCGRVDSPPQSHWKESALVTAEDPAPSSPRTTPPPGGARPQPEEPSRPRPHHQPDPLNTGPASRSPPASGFSSHAYVSCSDLEGEYVSVGVGRGAGGGVAQARGGPGGGSESYPPLQEDVPGRRRHREAPAPAPAPPRPAGGETSEAARLPYQRGGQQGALYPPAVGDGTGGPRRPWSPLVAQPITGSAHAAVGPAHRTGAEHNGYGEEDGRHGGSGDDHLSYDPPSLGGLLPPGRIPYPQSPRRRPHRAPADLSPVSAPPPSPTPALSRVERMAALERRMLSDGEGAGPGAGHAPGATWSRRGLGPPAAGRVNGCFTPSGSESSEGDSDTEADPASGGRGGGYVLTGGSTVEGRASGPLRSRLLPRTPYSLGSLELDEGAGVDESHAFTDDDTGRVFSC
ncbi:unnamed protein product [Arctogadus glacialis]